MTTQLLIFLCYCDYQDGNFRTTSIVVDDHCLTLSFCSKHLESFSVVPVIKAISIVVILIKLREIWFYQDTDFIGPSQVSFCALRITTSPINVVFNLTCSI